jgi:hypothetical protein
LIRAAMGRQGDPGGKGKRRAGQRLDGRPGEKDGKDGSGLMSGRNPLITDVLVRGDQHLKASLFCRCEVEGAKKSAPESAAIDRCGR